MGYEPEGVEGMDGQDNVGDARALGGGDVAGEAAIGLHGVCDEEGGEAKRHGIEDLHLTDELMLLESVGEHVQLWTDRNLRRCSGLGLHLTWRPEAAHSVMWRTHGADVPSLQNLIGHSSRDR